MGRTKQAQPTILTFALLYNDEEYKTKALELIRNHFGELAETSVTSAFDYSRYYEKEIGPNLTRQYFAVAGTFYQGDIAEVKITANKIEDELADAQGNRRVNIDPSYVTIAKLIVPTTKDATYRVYIRDGIYAQPMLYFLDNTFVPWEWTYNDYTQPEAIEFFNRVRKRAKTEFDASRKKDS